MFLNFADVKGGAHEAYPTPLVEWFDGRSGFEPNFLRVDRCCEVRLGLVVRGVALGIRFWVCLRNSVRLVEGLQYVGCLVVRGWFLKWNCFFIVWVRRLADFRTR